jgi:hypothetical protein
VGIFFGHKATLDAGSPFFFSQLSNESTLPGAFRTDIRISCNCLLTRQLRDLTWVWASGSPSGTGLMIATITAYDASGDVSHSDTRNYPDISFVWEHVGCQQNNRRTIEVHVATDLGIEYEVRFSPWTPTRRFSPSRRFRALLERWSARP